MLLDHYRLFLVDMDDTLYLEQDYVLSGLRAVARCVSENDTSFGEHSTWLTRRFLVKGRQSIFDEFLAYWPDLSRRFQIADLVDVYRRHAPDITLLPAASKLIDALQQRGKVVIVTDGLPEMQIRKFEALGLSQQETLLFMCWAYNDPKPGVVELQKFIQDLPRPAVYIGDNPDHDLQMASKMGIDAIRIRQGRFRAKASSPWPQIAEFDSLGSLLQGQPKT